MSVDTINNARRPFEERVCNAFRAYRARHDGSAEERLAATCAGDAATMACVRALVETLPTEGNPDVCHVDQMTSGRYYEIYGRATIRHADGSYIDSQLIDYYLTYDVPRDVPLTLVLPNKTIEKVAGLEGFSLGEWTPCEIRTVAVFCPQLDAAAPTWEVVSANTEPLPPGRVRTTCDFSISCRTGLLMWFVCWLQPELTPVGDAPKYRVDYGTIVRVLRSVDA